MENILNKICICLLLVVLSSCNTKKAFIQQAKKDSTPVVLNTDSLEKATRLAEIMSGDVAFNEIAINGKMNVTIEDDEQKIQFVLKMKQDSIIWVSLRSSLGLEALRIVLLKDSIFYFNRLEKEYSKQSLSYLHQLIGAPLTLKQLQGLILGNITPLTNGKLPAIDTSNFFHIQSFEQYAVSFQGTEKPKNRIKSVSAISKIDPKMLDIRYDDFIDQNAIYYPGSLFCAAIANKQLKFELFYEKINSESGNTYVFNIPPKFKKQ